MLVNRDLISKLAMTKEFALGMAKISSTNENESLIVYSLEVKLARIGTKNFCRKTVALKKERLNCRLQHCEILCQFLHKNSIGRAILFVQLLFAVFQLTYQYLFLRVQAVWRVHSFHPHVPLLQFAKAKSLHKPLNTSRPAIAPERYVKIINK